MKQLAILLFVVVTSVLPGVAQNQNVKEKLRNFFFGLPFNVDINVLRTELGSNSSFKFHQDPNRDEQKTIVGSIKESKNLNPLCVTNQVIIQYSSAEPKKNKNVSLKWSMNYKLEDLPSATVDFEKLKSEFKPLLSDYSETKKTGALKEKITSLTLKEKSLTIIITLVEYINFSHTISLEYRDAWKIIPTNPLKVK